MSQARSNSISTETLPMSVSNMGFMLERLGRDCSPLQFLRELTQNGLEAISRLEHPVGQIVWDVDWNLHALEGVLKLSIVDTGAGMTGPEMVEYINKLSSSIHTQSHDANFGIGAKIAAAPLNPEGLIYLSWKDGIGYMIRLWKDPISGEYGLVKFERRDGTFDHWTWVEDSVRPEEIGDHGTKVILLGRASEDRTIEAPKDARARSRWIARYLNTRYFEFPEGISVRAREGWEHPRESTDLNLLRTVQGQRPYLDEHAIATGTVPLTRATARWWVLKDESALTQNSGHIESTGHTAALFQNELYELQSGRSGVARLQGFGVIFGHRRVVIYVAPELADGVEVSANTARTRLQVGGSDLPWLDWASEFASKLPAPIEELVENAGANRDTHDSSRAIRERLKNFRDLFKISRYRPSERGTELVDPSSHTKGGSGSSSNGASVKSTKDRNHSTHQRSGDSYVLFQSAGGVSAEEIKGDNFPEAIWISVADGTRESEDLEDRAAKFLPDRNVILINADFRVFTDMIRRWTKYYSNSAGTAAVVDQVVREWFEQQLVEAVLGAQALRASRHWTSTEIAELWSEETLTAVVLPRYHVDNSVKRALGAKLGTLASKSR